MTFSFSKYLPLMPRCPTKGFFQKLMTSQIAFSGTKINHNIKNTSESMGGILFKLMAPVRYVRYIVTRKMMLTLLLLLQQFCFGVYFMLDRGYRFS